MHKTIYHLLVGGLALLFLAGCATPSNHPKLQLQGYNPGPILVIATNIRNLNYVTPMGKTESAEKSANLTAKAVASTWDDEKPLESLFATAFYTTLTVPFAATIGALRGVKPEEVQAAQTNLLKALQENPIDKKLCQAICARGAKNTGLVWLTPAVAPEAATNTNTNVSLIVEFEFLNYSLEPRGWQKQDTPLINSKLIFALTVRCNLLRPTDREELFTDSWSYTSSSRNFTDWTKNDAALLKQAIEKSSEDLSKRIIHDIFQ
jgi:hypothetical protein